MYLVISVESTDLPQPHLSVAHPAQPHLLNFAGIVMDEAGNEVDQLSTLVKPRRGAALPLRSYQARGICLELALREGEDAVDVFAWFTQYAAKVNCIVGHGLAFRIDIVRILSARITGEVWAPSCSTFCTMEHAAPKVREPRMKEQAIVGGYGHAGPSLSQCLDHFFSEPIGGSIDELTAVRACDRIYRHLSSKI